MATGKFTDFAWELHKNLPTLTKPRTDFISLFILSILKVGTVNLVKISIGMGVKAVSQSNYRRIQRFIAEVSWCYRTLVPLILKWSGIDGPLTLIIDRTNWKLGKSNINILCISVLGDGFCVPIIWKLLPKRGNSSQEERIDLIGKMLEIPNLPEIKTIIGDREFIGTQWFKYLNTNNIGILFRVKDNQYAKRYNKYYKVCNIIKGNTRNGRQCNGKQYWMDDVQVYIHGFRYKNGDGKLEYLIVASFDKNTKMSEEYSNRWYIESMFKNFKTNGFNMEDTHVTNLDRLETLFGLLTLGYICAINAGKIILKEKPHLFKISSNGRPKLSIFRAGIDDLLNVLLNGLVKRFNLIFKFLSCA
jgi:Transposase DDE domain